jgi:hypothetical protein
VLGLFNLLQRVGGWRWNSWDVRERFTLRRNPLPGPSRIWATFVAAGLTAIAIVGAVLVAVGTDDANLPLVNRDGWTSLVVAVTIGLIVLSIGKDVVDNDVEVDGRLTGGRAPAEPGMVAPPP